MEAVKLGSCTKDFRFSFLAIWCQAANGSDGEREEERKGKKGKRKKFKKFREEQDVYNSSLLGPEPEQHPLCLSNTEFSAGAGNAKLTCICQDLFF